MIPCDSRTDSESVVTSFQPAVASRNYRHLMSPELCNPKPII
jgi:hypothetical protein